MRTVWIAAWGSCCLTLGATQPHPCVSGVYPHLAMFNNEDECGIGAIVPFANRLWAVTYAPHAAHGSSDKLYEITADLNQITRPESIGGTAANRLIHTESSQLLIGPYLINTQGQVRAISFTKMPGRLAAAIRHLSNPASKIYFATMEEGLYEVNLRSLTVRELFRDANQMHNRNGDLLPGSIGRGAYAGQGRIIYANSGEPGNPTANNPQSPAGALAEWDGRIWKMVRRAQFTDITGPGGIYGNEHPETDPVWAIGYDYRSLVLMLLDRGTWYTYRLPKASHANDGTTGWNVEWPRIRDIGETNLLMAMHGTLWSFPRDFRAANTQGLCPRSTCLRALTDFCAWQSNVVFACDDTARSYFQNHRKMDGTLKGPGQSNSNLWFVKPEQIDSLGPVIGHGAVWMGDEVFRRIPCYPYLFAGYQKRGVVIAHGAKTPVDFLFEIDVKGDGSWQPLETITAPPGEVTFHDFPANAPGVWIRTTPQSNAPDTYVVFQYSNPDARPATPAPIFNGLAAITATNALGGLVFVRGNNRRTLGVVAETATGHNSTPRTQALYELDADLHLNLITNDCKSFTNAIQDYKIANPGFSSDTASIRITDDAKNVWRLPFAHADYPDNKHRPFPADRHSREICTERDLLNVGGIFYELPQDNAGGFGQMRALATHDFAIHDFCSWRGLWVLTGIDPAVPASPHLIRSGDQHAAVWVGALDDLWSIGKVRGVGGPWKNAAVQPQQVSDPYLLTGFDQKRLTLSQTGAAKATFRIELDISGHGTWRPWKNFDVQDGETLVLEGTDTRVLDSAYWLRIRAYTACKATVWLIYN